MSLILSTAPARPALDADDALADVSFASSIGDLLRWRSRQQPDREAFVFTPDGRSPGVSITYGGLDTAARRVAGLLTAEIPAGSRALLLYPPGFDFIIAFFGCLYAGMLAVPAPVPRSRRWTARLQSIAVDCDPGCILTVDALRGACERGTADAGGHPLACFGTDTVTGDTACEPAPRTRDELAYLQYTSGSTAAPKGVMIRHGNVLQNLFDLDEGYGHSAATVWFSWLPHFHDMGLVLGLLLPLYQGSVCHFMSPLAFVQRPLAWLWAIARNKVTHSAGPNFAYDLCARRAAVSDIRGLDLTSWQVAACGAEPIRRATIERFLRTFGPYGFTPSVFEPGYGLAEATLKVATRTVRRPPVYRTVSAAALAEHRLEPARTPADARTFVGCGTPSNGTRIAIVDPVSQRCVGPHGVGEIWVAGPGVGAGYWKRPEETCRTFEARLIGSDLGPFLRTGDLGFQCDGDIYIVGRLKDVIIIAGRKLHPEDLEPTVESCHPAIRCSGCAVFGLERDGEERMAVVVELDRTMQRAGGFALRRELEDAIRRALGEQHDVPVYRIWIVSPGTLPKTSSGKIQRQACRALCLAGEFDAAGPMNSTRQVEKAPADMETSDGSC